MKWILWLGIMPFIYGIKLLWNWTIRDFRQWEILDSTYKRALPLRIIVATALIALGLWLFFGVGAFLGERYQ